MEKEKESILTQAKKQLISTFVGAMCVLLSINFMFISSINSTQERTENRILKLEEKFDQFMSRFIKITQK